MNTEGDTEWDTGKARSNFNKHGVAFEEIENFDWDTALIEYDDRENYGEERWIALGLIGLAVHVCVFTQRGDARRIISLRKAERKETIHFLESLT